MGVSCVVGERPSNWQLPALWHASPLLEFHVIAVLGFSNAASESFTKTNILL